MKRYFLLLAFFLFCTDSVAQNPAWVNYTYAGNVVAMASEGDYIWAATEGGLVRLNTITHEREFFNKANSGLPSNNITAVAVDKNGNKWIGTSRGLVKYDGSTWIRISDLKLTALTVDSLGGVWYAVEGLVNGVARHKLLRYSGGLEIDYSDTLKSADPEFNVSYGSLAWMTRMTTDRKGTVWIYIGTRGHLYFDPASSSKGYIENLPYRYSDNKIFFDQENNMWIVFSPRVSTDDSSGVIVVRYGDTILLSDQTQELRHLYIRNVHQDSNGALYFVSDRIIKKFFGGEWSYIVVQDSIERITSTWIDEEDVVWFGSENRLTKVENNNFQYFFMSNSGLRSQFINSVTLHETDEGVTSWLATSKGLTKFNGNQWFNYRSFKEKVTRKMDLDYIQQVAIDKKGGIWLIAGQFLYGQSYLAKFNEQDTSIIIYRDLNLSIRNITPDPVDGIWMSHKDGLAWFDGTDLRELKSSMPDTIQKFLNFRSPVFDKYGIAWFIINDQQLYRYANNNWTRYEKPEYVMLLRGLNVTQDGKMWITGESYRTEDSTNWINSYYLFEFTDGVWRRLPDPPTAAINIIADTEPLKWLYHTGGSAKRIYWTNGIIYGAFDTTNTPLSGDGLFAFTVNRLTNQLWFVYRNSYTNGLFIFTGTLSSVSDQPKENFSPTLLGENYPNPARDFTTIRYSIPEGIAGDVPVEVRLFDPMGKEIVSLMNTRKPSGTYEEKFDVSSLQNGVYFYRLRVGNTSETKQLVIMR